MSLLTPKWDLSSSLTGRIKSINESQQVVVELDINGNQLQLDLPSDPQLAGLWTAASPVLENHRVAVIFHTVDKEAAPLLVVEPELTLDVTEAAALVTSHGPQASLLATRRLRAARASTEAMIRGTVINAALDILVRFPGLHDSAVIAEAMKVRPIALAQLAVHGNDHRTAEQALTQAIPALRQMIASWNDASVVLEPFLISPILGLQGRADIVLRRGDDVEVIELKAGKPPSLERLEHSAQAASYAALLSASGQATGTIRSHLWYVQDSQNPLREVEGVDDRLRMLIEARNAIVLGELSMAAGNMHALQMTMQPLGTGSMLSRYEVQEVMELQSTLVRLRPRERQAASEWLRMSSNELVASRLGGGSARCAADLWRMTPEQRRQSSSVLDDLTVDVESSNFTTMHLVFRRPEPAKGTSIRIGDLVVLRRVGTASEHHATTSMVLYKGSIRALDRDRVTVSLRNKFADVDQYQREGWLIEQDVVDAGIRSMSSSIRSWMDAPELRRDLLLGGRIPRHGTPRHATAPDLTDHQRSIVERAVAAEELFLIQGPPGTGKTSRVLRAIIQELLRTPDERIMALAFTNRAANEIADVLEKHAIDYLRHGSIEGATGERSIPHLASKLSAEELSAAIRSSRVIVATIAAVHANPEIWGFGDVTSIIVDEASQIIEPQLIGILSRGRRSILIGDHCQLPAVISQPAANLTVRYPALADICLTDLGMSTFERLIRCAEQRGDAASVAMLTQQGRMHAEVMAFPSTAFYGGRLQCLRDDQHSTAPLPWHSVIADRTCMFDVDSINQTRAEAEIIAQLTRDILRHPRQSGAPPRVGIITPFRVQNNAIAQLLETLLDDAERQAVTVDTVERFQGSERDVILYGTAVASAHEMESIRSEVCIGDAVIDRKLNVAMTRAKQQFVLVGNARVLSISPIYAHLIATLPHRVRPS